MALAGGYVPAQASALTVKTGKSDQLSVKGLQGLTLPLGFTQQTSEASVIGTRIATKYATGASYEDINSNYYFAPGDTSQTYLMDCSRNATQIQDMWFWIDATDFVALDLISDPGGYVMVGTFSSPTATKNEIYSGSISLIIGGSHILFNKHIGGVGLTFTSGGSGVSAQVTDSGSGFLTAGFAVGDTVVITYLNSLDPLYAKIKTVTAGTMTFEDAVGNEATIPSHAGIAATKIHGGVPIEVTSSYS